MVRSLAVVLPLLLLAAPAGAQPREPLVGQQFNIDLYQGPVIGSSRVIGLGGAYTALAEDAVGIQFNPASAVNRPWYSHGRWDWDLTADWLLPNVLGRSNFSFDTSQLDTAGGGSQTVLEVGGLVQYKHFGLGAYYQMQLFDREFGAPPDTRTVQFNFTNAHVDLGYGFLDHQLVVAGGVRIGSLTAAKNATNLFQLTGTGPEAGVVYRPRHLPFRLGAAFYAPLRRDKATPPPDDPDFADLALPRDVVLPWQITFGGAWQLLRRPMNPTPDYGPPPPAFYQRLPASQPATAPASAPAVAPRDPGSYYVLLTADLQVAAPVEDAVGIASFFNGLREDSGQGYSVSVRIGVEAEVWRRRLRLRAGTYYEPSRLSDASGRMHGTGGLDVRVFDFRLYGARSLRMGLVCDFARNYSNAGISVGFWH